MHTVVAVVVLLSAIGVATDASRLGARRGGLGGGFLDMGPAGWFFATLLLWIVALPCYLAKRPQLARRAHGLTYLPQPSHASVPVGPVPSTPFVNGYPAHRPLLPAADPALQLPPPGYYPNPDPSDGHGMRWWDGAAWEMPT